MQPASVNVVKNAKNYLKYLALGTVKYYQNYSQNQKLNTRLLELERRNQLLSQKLIDIEGHVRSGVFGKGVLDKSSALKEIDDEIKHQFRREQAHLFPPDFFSVQQNRKTELERKIDEKFASKPVQEKKIDHTRLKKIPVLDNKEKRRKELEIKVHLKLNEEVIRPYVEKINEIKKEYNRLRRLKKYKGKKGKLKNLKVRIDKINDYLSKFKYPSP